MLQRGFKPEQVVPFCYRPFDDRWLYWEPNASLLDRPREEYFPHLLQGNIWLAAVQQNRKSFEPPVITGRLCSLHVIERGANLFPAFLHVPTHDSQRQPNLSRDALTFLSHQAFSGHGAETIFHHVVAILYSSLYSKTNTTALRQDWPRIPLPPSKEQLIESSKLGQSIVSLVDTDNPVAHVTAGTIRPELATIAIVSRSGGDALNPDASDLDVTAGWGHAGTGGAVMPGRGKAVERDYTAQEREGILHGAQALGLAGEKALSLLGTGTFEVYLNNFAYWKNIPARVWEYRIGGYQVIKKWLSYRELTVLGRSLTIDEMHYVTAMARRIAAILLLEPQLDANYTAIAQSPYPWPRPETASPDKAASAPR